MKRELELYIHIPFCISKCAYCDFLSGPATKEVQMDYVNALIKEIKSYDTLASEYVVTTIFIGGGTPSVLDAQWMEEIFRAVRGVFSIEADVEITLEMNPGTVNQKKMERYYNLGVNRISIGLQTTNNKELRHLGRIHTYEEFEKTYWLARNCGFQNINIDLISAIPYQSCESWKTTLETVAKLNPEHISAYSLIIEEGTSFYKMYGEHQGGRNALPTEEEERKMYEDTERILDSYGYHRYEISNYAKPGFECTHNCGYWRRTEYLGIGVGSASLIGNQRVTNIRDQKSYVDLMNLYQRKDVDTAFFEKLHIEEEELTEQAVLEETIFLGMRLREGIKVTEAIAKRYGSLIQRYLEAGYFEIDQNRLRLTNEGISVSNSIFSEFIDYNN